MLVKSKSEFPKFLLNIVIRVIITYISYLLLIPVLVFVAYHLIVIIATIATNIPQEIIVSTFKAFGAPETFSFKLEGAEGFKIFIKFLTIAYFYLSLFVMIIGSATKYLYKKITHKEFSVNKWSIFKFYVILMATSVFLTNLIFLIYGTAIWGYLIFDIVWLAFTIFFLFIYTTLREFQLSLSEKST